MRRVELVLLCAVAFPAFAQNNAQNYNGTDTFAPGKKYTCVPTADRKGWDCNEAGKTVEVKTKQGDTTPEPSAPPPDPAPPPPPQPSSRSTLPSYLTNAAASNPAPISEPPSTVSAAAARANAPSSPPPAATMAPPASTMNPPASTTRTVPLRPSKPDAAAATPPPSRPPTKPPLSPRVTHPPVVETSSAGSEFMMLPGDHFVVEIAHASSKRELDAVQSATHIPNGDLYAVHLRQNGADAWLLLWGSFDTLEAARAARTMLTNAATVPGWPRRIAPLQAEARRVSP